MRFSLAAIPLLNVLAALAGGLCMRYAFGLEPVWWLAWWAPGLVLFAALRSSRRAGVLLVTLAGLVAASGNFHYYTLVMPLPAALLVTLLQALSWTLVIGLSRRLMLRGSGHLSVFAYPLLAAAFDTVVAHVLPDGNWASIGYSQIGFLPALQIVSLAGMAGLVFVVSLPAAALAQLAAQRPAGRVATGRVAGVVLIVGLALGYGVARLSLPAAGAGVTVGLAAIDDFIGPRTPAAAERVWRQYERHIAGLAARKATLIVLPEKIAVVDPAQARLLQQRLGAQAVRMHVWLMAGVGVEQGRQRQNLAWLFDPSGRLVHAYRKQRLAPGEGAFVPGTRAEVARIGPVLAGLAICKDVHFAATARDYRRLGADLVLVPSWDFGEDAVYAARLSAVRAIENGFAMVRVAREGMLTVSDPFGRVVAEVRSAPLPGATLLASLPAPRPGATVYAGSGDVFGWLCVACALAMLLAWRVRFFAPHD